MNEEQSIEEKDFDFKYVPVEDFKMILKQVRRERQKKKDEAKWDKFVRMKEEEAEQKKRLLDVTEGLTGVKVSDSPPPGVLRGVVVRSRPQPPPPQPLPPPAADHWREIESYRDSVAVQAPSNKGAEDRWRRHEPREYIRTIPPEIPLSPRLDQPGEECWWDRGGVDPDEVTQSCPPESVGRCEQGVIPPQSPVDIPLQFVQQKPRSYVRQVHESDKESTAAETQEGGGVSILTEDLSRIEDQCVKIKVCLEGAISQLVEPPLPDHDDDEERIKKRGMEFASRFTRNYLCELRRQMGDIKKQLNCHGSESGWSSSKPQMVPQFHKFTQAFQTSLQAFSLIEKSSPSIFLASVPPPVFEFLTAFNELCYLTNVTYCDGTSAKLMEMEEMSASLENILNDLKSRPLDSAKAKKKTSKKDGKKGQPGKKKKDKYFMYKSNNCFEKTWKKKTQILAKAKLGQVSHRSKTETTPPQTEPAAPRIPEPKMVARQRPTRRQGTRVPENEVKTMMEFVPPQEGSDSEGETKNAPETEELIREETSATEKQVVNQNTPVVDDAVKTMISSIMVEVLHNMNILTAKHDALGPLDYGRNLSSYTHSGINYNINNLISSDPNSLKNINNWCLTPRPPSPPKNVSLICIKETQEEKEVILENIRESIATTTFVAEVEVSRPPPEISLVQTIDIDPKTRYSVLDYKHFFGNYKSYCPLYCGQEDPWDIISRLTEKILDTEIVLQINTLAEEQLKSMP